MTLLQSIHLKLDEFEKCHNKQQQIDSIMGGMGDMFVYAGIKTFGSKKLRNVEGRKYKTRNKLTPNKP